MALNGFVLDPKAWKENANLAHPLSAMELVCDLVPARYLLCPTPLATPKQEELSALSRSMKSFSFNDTVNTPQFNSMWNSVDDSVSQGFDMILPDASATEVFLDNSLMEELSPW